MPFATAVSPFVGDDDMGDFLLDVWEPFANNDMGWVANRLPGAAPSLPNAEVWTHRGTTGSPEPPFIFLRTNGKHIWHFCASGIDTGEAITDQPGEPFLNPYPGDFTEPSDNNQIQDSMRCPFSNSLVGPYQAYWLFGDTGGTYIHCVVKVAARQYRHFHVGLLQGLHSDLHADSFYMTCHFWNNLDPDGLSHSSGQTHEHLPYGLHIPPFPTATAGSTTTFSKKHQLTSFFYMPGLRGDLSTQFFMPTGNLGTVDVGSSDILGQCDVAGYGQAFGRVLWNCDKTFTSGLIPLIPIYVAAGVPFGGQERMAPVAQIPDVYRVNMRDLTPEQEIVIGSDTYVVFPVINSDSANTVAGEGYSGWEGLAYRKETGAVT